MKRIFVVIFAVMALVACDSKKEAADQAASAAESVPAQADGLVSVPAEGVPFEPAIQKSQLPDGVYYCDMGTVHYARGEQGDNKCPLCNMMLTYKKPSGEEAAANAPAEGEQAGEDHEGHDHE